MSIISFKNKGTKDIAMGELTKESLKILPYKLHHLARIKLSILDACTTLSDLTDLKGNRFEKLKGNRNGQYSIRINSKYRVCFFYQKKSCFDVEVVDYR